MFDDRDSPELYDLRLGSGVVLLEEGVTLFRGIAEGDWAHDRGRKGMGSACAGGVYGIGCAWGAVDIRFSRRASVGLMVRAPRPVATGGMTETRLDADDDGVVVLPAVCLTGVRTALVEEDREWSVVPDAVRRPSRGSLGGGWNDLAFIFLVVAGTFVGSF